jgi:hypothetical protein
MDFSGYQSTLSLETLAVFGALAGTQTYPVKTPNPSNLLSAA